MQKTKLLSLIIITFGLVFSSCEKVIEVDLNSASPRYVIEGAVAEGNGPHRIKITRTKNFDEPNDFEEISHAAVTIADDAGNSCTLYYSGKGIYRTADFAGVPGRTYYLTVQAGGETFTAESVMPGPVSFDSLYVQEFNSFGSMVKIPVIRYSDAPGIKNFYRHILYVNNRRIRSIFLNSDEGNDGQQTERSLPFFMENGEDQLTQDSTIAVKIQSVDKPVYDYFYSLEQTISQNAATPANPVSNIKGGALGYFSAHSEKKKKIVLE